MIYLTCDVLACSVSILHLMFISIARYRGIRRPFQHRADDEDSVLYRILLTWLLGLFLASPIPVLAVLDMQNVMPNERACQINNQYFVIIGSLLSFYLPLVTILIMYILTVQQLRSLKVSALFGQRHVGIPKLLMSTETTFQGKSGVDGSRHSVTPPIDTLQYTRR